MTDPAIRWLARSTGGLFHSRPRQATVGSGRPHSGRLRLQLPAFQLAPGQESITSTPSLPPPAPESPTAIEGNIDVWNDLVSVRDLVVALAVSVVAVTISCVIASWLKQPLLFWGLGGSAAGFAVNCLLISPKRDVRIVNDAEAGIGASAADAPDTGRARLEDDK